MKEEKTKSKRKWIYYVVLGICALLLIAATVLTVYFVTENNRVSLEKPPAVDTPKDPNEPNEPNEPENPEDPNEPNEPSSGDGVRFVKPVDCETYAVVFGELYENKTLGWWYRHKAIDFEADAGTDVVSMADGTVESVSYSEETGNYIVIDHGDGLKTLYRYIEPVTGLKAGDTVKMGQKIGEIAESYGAEAWAGAHLHLEVEMNGKAVDPTDYLEPVLDEK